VRLGPRHEDQPLDLSAFRAQHTPAGRTCNLGTLSQELRATTNPEKGDLSQMQRPTQSDPIPGSASTRRFLTKLRA